MAIVKFLTCSMRSEVFPAMFTRAAYVAALTLGTIRADMPHNACDHYLKHVRSDISYGLWVLLCNYIYLCV